MRDVDRTIGGIIAKANCTIIGSVDVDGSPNTKAMLHLAEERVLKTILYY